MKHLFQRLHRVLIAIAALALSAGLAFGAQPDASLSGLANASLHAGKTVPDKAGQQDESTDEETSEDTDEDVDEAVDEEGTGGGDNCSTDPTTLTPEELDLLKHGSIVCWAAHQKAWPEWFANHGAQVRCWAHTGKAEAPSCTEDPTLVVPAAGEDAAATSHGNGKGQGKGKSKDK